VNTYSNGPGSWVVDCALASHADVMEVCLELRHLRRGRNQHITLVIRYNAYRDPVEQRLIVDLLEAAGVDSVVSLDELPFACPFTKVDAVPTFLEYLTQRPIDLVVAVGEDQRLAFRYAIALDVGIGSSVEGRNCVIVDDTVTSAEGLCKVGRVVAMRGAKRVVACVTHGALTHAGLDAINASPLSALVVSDSLPSVFGDAACPKLTRLSLQSVLTAALAVDNAKLF
jgi:ribose-phosphate pyrophosphokinase